MLTGTAGRDREQEVREYLGRERRDHGRVYSAGRCSRCDEAAPVPTIRGLTPSWLLEPAGTSARRRPSFASLPPFQGGPHHVQPRESPADRISRPRISSERPRQRQDGSSDITLQPIPPSTAVEYRLGLAQPLAEVQNVVVDSVWRAMQGHPETVAVHITPFRT